MELPLTPTADCEVRSVIRILIEKNKSATEIHQEMCSEYGDDVKVNG